VKASFHTGMSCESFIPHCRFWNEQKSRVLCRTPVCPSQNVLCFFIPHRYFQNQCRIMQLCGSQNGLLVLDSALTFSRTSNILEKTKKKLKKKIKKSSRSHLALETFREYATLKLELWKMPSCRRHFPEL